jgi:DTW domain-containing protein YfiP
MNKQQYLQNRIQFHQELPKYRNLCVTCLQPDFSCYCKHVKKVNPNIKFVILIHPIEFRRRIATGRMAHLSLENSLLVMGQDYTHNKQINQIIDDPEYQSVILYPGQKSLNLTTDFEKAKTTLFHPGKKLALFVIDGTWATARKTMRLSQNLKNLPRVGFIPPGLSQFRVRKQPKPECYSTIEAIHHSIELLGEIVGFDTETRKHDQLIHLFKKVIDRQVEFVLEAEKNPRANCYRRPRYVNR